MRKDFDKIFQSFNKLKVLIIGDVMIDSYFIGKVDRISPEAPVPIVAVEKKENRLGGAANVALNIKALGAEPILCSIIGKDFQGDIFLDLLKNNQITSKGIIRSSSRITTTKTRVIGNNVQMLRIDEEKVEEITSKESNKLINLIEDLIKEVDVIIFEDYDKGLLNSVNIQKIIQIANRNKIPTTVDPKKRNFLEYKNATLFKPNLKEIKDGLKTEVNLKERENLIKAINNLKKILDNKMALVTMSENGVLITNYIDYYHLSAHVRNIADVSGAGDTVISVAALCLALKLDIQTIAYLSNLAGGLVCESVGVIPINKELLLKEAKLHAK